MPDEKASLQEDAVLAHADLGCHVRAVAQRQELVMTTSGKKKIGQLQRVRCEHVVVGEAVYEHEGAGQVACQWQQAAAVISRSVCLRVAQVALGIARVVQPPLGDGRPCNCRVEHMRHLQHCQCCKVAAEGPSDDADPARVDVSGVKSGQCSHGGRLVLKRWRCEVVVHAALP